MFEGLGKLSIPDGVKTFVVALLTAMITAGWQAIQTGVADVKTVGKVALAAGLAYIIKQLVTDTDGKLLGKV